MPRNKFLHVLPDYFVGIIVLTVWYLYNHIEVSDILPNSVRIWYNSAETVDWVIAGIILCPNSLILIELSAYQSYV